MTDLVIVESPGKLKKIRSILGKDYMVEASVGHVRDLPENDLGVTPPTFKPHYVKTTRGKDVLTKLSAAVKKCNRVFLATDPDREGEAIAWHLKDALGLRNAQRITFQSIDTKAVKAGVAAPRAIDMQLVHAQEGRRVLDRLIGYTVSSVLSDIVGRTMSAGRVQSPAVLLVVQREREIRAFQPTAHFGATLTFAGNWTAQWETKPHIAEGQPYFLDGAFAKRVADVRDLRVTAFKDSVRKAPPKPPFTTMTLQKAAQVALKFKPKLTMDLAQKLYEAGAITYHRTDTPNLADDAFKTLIAFAASAGIPMVEQQRRWKAKPGAQEAHEACRPTHFEEREAGETPEQKALYRLIWARAVACQMPDAVYAVRTAQLTAASLVGPTGKPVTFLARGQTLTSPGWKAVYEEPKEPEAGDKAAAPNEEDDAPDDNPVPALQVGAAATATSGKVERLTTKAPKRYNQASLIEEMERLGIGRPSTYAAILQNVITRNYISEDKKDFLHACPDGEALVDALVGKCSFIELDYTRAREDDLDAIAQGKAQYVSVVSSVHQQLTGEMVVLGQAAPAGHPCPACGKPMRRRNSSKGHFWGCSGYPDCKTTLPDDDGKPGAPRAPSEKPAASAAPASSEHTCSDCGKPLQRRQGTSAKGAYDFYGCTGYPKCKTTYRTGPDGLPVR